MPTDTTANNKRIAKNTIFLYFRSLFLILITLYTSRIVLKTLGVEDYGIYNIVGGVVNMVTILSATMSSASQRFITYTLGENNNSKLKTVFSTCMTLHILIGVCVIILLELVGTWFLYI